MGGGCHDGVGTLGKLREKLQNKNSWSFADKLRSLQDKKNMTMKRIGFMVQQVMSNIVRVVILLY